MYFSNEKAIFIQMAERLQDEIVGGKYKDDDRIPSVREYAVMLEVNTNTAMKTYEHLARLGIIYNRRGMGYYVSPGAATRIKQQEREAFLNNALPRLCQKMRLLGITIEEVENEFVRLDSSCLQPDLESSRDAK